MKAIIWTKYGPPDALKLAEVDKPIPKDNEVLIKIRATTVTAGDCEMRSLRIPVLLRLPMRAYVGFRRPKRMTILGQELAGEVEAVGKDVTRFHEGDQVFGATGFGLGAYAEYITLPERSEDGVLAIKPANLTYDEAAAVPVGGLEALHFLARGNIRRGQAVLISGAGGSIGTIAVQIARDYGARVTAVDSTGKLDMLHSIGAGPGNRLHTGRLRQQRRDLRCDLRRSGQELFLPQLEIAQAERTLPSGQFRFCPDGSGTIDFDDEQQESNNWDGVLPDRRLPSSQRADGGRQD